MLLIGLGLIISGCSLGGLTRNRLHPQSCTDAQSLIACWINASAWRIVRVHAEAFQDRVQIADNRRANLLACDLPWLLGDELIVVDQACHVLTL